MAEQPLIPRSLNEEQTREIKEAFDLFDIDGTGRIEHGFRRCQNTENIARRAGEHIAEDHIGRLHALVPDLLGKPAIGCVGLGRIVEDFRRKRERAKIPLNLAGRTIAASPWFVLRPGNDLHHSLLGFDGTHLLYLPSQTGMPRLRRRQRRPCAPRQCPGRTRLHARFRHKTTYSTIVY